MTYNLATVWRVSLIVALLTTITVLCLTFPVEKVLNQFIVWVQNDVGPWGPLVLALAYIPCTIFAIPASILTLGGGYLFGLVAGFATDSVGSTAGATAAFFVGRTVGRPYVTSKLKDYPQFQAISLAIEMSGFKICLLLRMVPLLPFNMLNYLLSVTPLSVGTYAVASWVGMMPMTLLFVYIGTTIKDITDMSHGGGHFTTGRWIMLIGGSALSVLVMIIVSRIAKNALQKAVDETGAKPDEMVVAVESIAAVDALTELQQPLIIRIETTKNHSAHQLAPL